MQAEEARKAKQGRSQDLKTGTCREAKGTNNTENVMKTGTVAYASQKEYSSSVCTFMMESAYLVTQATSRPLKARFATTKNVTTLYPWKALDVQDPPQIPASSSGAKYVKKL